MNVPPCCPERMKDSIFSYYLTETIHALFRLAQAISNKCIIKILSWQKWQSIHIVYIINISCCTLFEPPRDKTDKMTVRPAKTQITLGIRPVWSESSLSAWRNLGLLATCWAHSEDSDQTGRMPRLIWVFAGRTVTLLVLSCRGSFLFVCFVVLRPSQQLWSCRDGQLT